MNLKSPLRRKYEAEALIEAGADELYCGVCHEGTVTGHKFPRDNLTNIQELREVIQISRSYNRDVSLTLNRQTYSDYKKITYIAEKAASLGVNSFIVCDDTLIGHLNKLGIGVDMHLSCLASCFNTESIMLYKALGIKRVTLPRQLTIKEIEQLSKKAKGIDLEVMIYNGRCKNDNGLCRFNHPSSVINITRKRRGYDLKRFRMFKNLTPKQRVKVYCSMMGNLIYHNKRRLACTADYNIKALANYNPNNHLNLNIIHNYFTKTLLSACGLCAIHPFNKAGIKSVKLVGREAPLVKKFYQTLLIKESINLLKICANKKQFENRVRHLQDSFTENLVCNKKNCYYYYY